MGNEVFVWVVYLTTYAFIVGYTLYLLWRLGRSS